MKDCYQKWWIKSYIINIQLDDLPHDIKLEEILLLLVDRLYEVDLAAYSYWDCKQEEDH